ncbi:hypothetical protein COL940_008719 [Colletotrichum noveboracense]|nr:hypothetical protein COL940_008719 [Colletotrichum noveboracense]
MWRFFRPRVSTLAARALAPKVQGKQTIVVQRVKVTKSRFRARSFFLGAGISLACWQMYWSTVLNPFFRHVDREYESLSAAEKKALDEEMDEETEPWFIPFPFTTKQVSQPPYKGTDPEWRQYVRISKDKELQNHIRVNRLRKILWPEAMTLSTWAFTSALVKQHFEGISRALGFEPSKPMSPFPSLPGGNVQQTKSEGPLPSANRQTPDGTPAENASHNVSKTSDSRQSGEPESGGRTNFVRDTAMSHIEGMKQITDGPAREFRKKLAQSWKPTRSYPPRGCILVSGFVEIELPRGFVVIDVWGHWNPKTEKFEPRSTYMILRRIQMKQQAPARG